MCGDKRLDIFRLMLKGDWEGVSNACARTEEIGPEFGRWAVEHHVSPYVLDLVAEAGAEESLPGVMEAMRTKQAWLKRLSEQLIAFAPSLDEILSAHGVDYLLLKGPAFAVRHYGATHRRLSGDLDVLVKQEQLGGAMDAVMGMGFRPKRRKVRRTRGGPRIRSQRLRTEHAIEFTREMLGIDLHWRLRNAPAYRFDMDAVWESRIEVEVEGRRYPTLSDEYALTLLLVSAAHDIGRGGCTVKPLLDARQVVLKMEAEDADWTEFFMRRRAEGLLSMCVNMLDVQMAVLGSRGDHGALNAALEAHRDCIAHAGDAEALRLVDRDANDIENTLWFLRVYPSRGVRDAMWWVDRNFPHPARITLAASRSVRFMGRLGWRLAAKRFRRGSS